MQVGQPYDKWGAVSMALFRRICSDKTGEDLERCQRWVGWIYLGTETDDEWFCSELVFGCLQTCRHSSNDRRAALGIACGYR